VQYVPDPETANGIVQELIQHRYLTLTLKSFKKLAWDRRPKTQAVIVDPVGYDAWVCCLEAPTEYPGWNGREWFATEGFLRSDCGREEYVIAFCRSAAAKIQAAYGGKWCGVCKEVNNDPYRGPLTQQEARDEVFQHVIDGPNNWGRVWLSSRRGRNAPLLPALKSVPQVEKQVTAAKRSTLDKLGRPTPASLIPMRFDVPAPAQAAQPLSGDQIPF